MRVRFCPCVHMCACSVRRDHCLAHRSSSVTKSENHIPSPPLPANPALAPTGAEESRLILETHVSADPHPARSPCLHQHVVITLIDPAFHRRRPPACARSNKGEERSTSAPSCHSSQHALHVPPSCLCKADSRGRAPSGMNSGSPGPRREEPYETRSRRCLSLCGE